MTGLGKCEYTVIAGKRAKKILLLLNKDFVLVTLVDPSTSTDAILAEMKSIGAKLIEF